jgi:AcrR family transcriptional regulator
MPDKKPTKPERTYTISLANRKPRGTGHERFGEILAAAKELFLEHGVENASTRRIAERVGISQTALFSYYKTKDDILSQLIRDALQELGKAMAEVDGAAADTTDWFRRCIAGYIGFGLNHPDEYRLAFMVLKPYRRPYNTSRIEEEPAEGYHVGILVFLQLEKRVDQAIREGVIRGDLGSSMIVAQALWASIHGLVAILIARPRPHFPWEDRDALIRVQTDILLNGMLAGPTRAPK